MVHSQESLRYEVTLLEYILRLGCFLTFVWTAEPVKVQVPTPEELVNKIDEKHWMSFACLTCRRFVMRRNHMKGSFNFDDNSEFRRSHEWLVCQYLDLVYLTTTELPLDGEQFCIWPEHCAKVHHIKLLARFVQPVSHAWEIGITSRTSSFDWILQMCLQVLGWTIPSSCMWMNHKHKNLNPCINELHKPKGTSMGSATRTA